MDSILDKISSYNIFNYLLPGTLFAAIGSKYSSYTFTHDNLFIAAFIYYFIGLVISRIGSLLIDPPLKKFGFLKFADYPKYVSASKSDELLDTLLESSNMFRTLSSLFLVLLALFLFDALAFKYAFLKVGSIYILSLGLFILFVFSYRKQTGYITKRVQVAGEEK